MIRKFLPFIVIILMMTGCKKQETDYKPIDKAIIEKYLADNSLTAQSTASGLYYIITKAGGLNHPGLTSAVTLKYKGYLTDDTVFDQTLATGLPTSFQLSGMIDGWKEGVPLIGIGGKIKLLIPSDLAYGATAKTGIPAHSVLIFDIELIDFY